MTYADYQTKPADSSSQEERSDSLFETVDA